jgi:hypothetical protein
MNQHMVKMCAWEYGTVSETQQTPLTDDTLLCKNGEDVWRELRLHNLNASNAHT